MATIWDVLGIKPTTDENEIRRAYARELKLRRPDKDPQGFQQLREAFDHAKHYAKGIVIQKTIPATDVSFDVQPATSIMDYVNNLMEEPSSDSEAKWQRKELKVQATEIAKSLVKNELAGLRHLHHYLDHEMPDALEARGIFSMELAEALGNQPWLDRSVVREVSAVMNWGVDNYRSSQLPPWLLNALEEQIAITDQENHWQYLARHYNSNSSYLEQLKWRLLTEKGVALPWWTRFIPDFVPGLNRQVTELRKQFPELIARLNPKLLEMFSRSTFGLSWTMLIAVSFWGYTAWLPGHESPKMAIQSVIMLVVVSSYLWVYPALDRKCPPESKSHKVLQSIVWLVSIAIIFLALYNTWRGAGFLIGNDRIFFLLFLMIPIGWFLWSRRKQWRTLPIGIVVTIIEFPALFIRKLPPVINLLGLLFLPMIYGILIQMIYFMK
ncbi:J domain-containing protein [Limnobaculum parvum]|uniref:Molecular chaperone DnaJ n=1 Tax=Limnobaculum parvum TaxID=2172103 RepID=A0A2Y9TWB7_9GAMM|nr:molecular chaperone DnaJ [Limnobaculum parvum]AWH87912.1 molecular chaperone DnaJ [Limnobaculum parvum]